MVPNNIRSIFKVAILVKCALVYDGVPYEYLNVINDIGYVPEPPRTKQRIEKWESGPTDKSCMVVWPGNMKHFEPVRDRYKSRRGWKGKRPRSARLYSISKRVVFSVTTISTVRNHVNQTNIQYLRSGIVRPDSGATNTVNFRGPFTKRCTRSRRMCDMCARWYQWRYNRPERIHLMGKTSGSSTAAAWHHEF